MDILVKRIINKPVDSNSFVIYKQGSTSCIVVDPGTPDCKKLLHFLNEFKLTPEYLILTHEHFDHIWGINKLKDIYGSKVICSTDCGEKITDKKKNMSVFYDQVGFQSYPSDISIEDLNFGMDFNGSGFEFIESRGHTNGSICIKVGDNLFTGDTIIYNTKTVIKFPGGDREKLKLSLKKLGSICDRNKTIIYPGHGLCFFLKDILLEELI